MQNTMALIYQSCVKTGADLSAELVAGQDMCDLWNIRIRPVPAYEWSGLDKCGGWIQSSLTCYALIYSWFGGLTHWGQTWREETLARRETFPRWTSASITNATLCKTEQAKIIAHTFSGVWVSCWSETEPPALKQRSTVNHVRAIESVFLLCRGVIRYSVN